MPNGLVFEGRYAHVGTYPIGIDPDQFVKVRDARPAKWQFADLYDRA